MGRYVVGAVAVVVAIWFAFAVFRALGALVHLGMIVAIVLVAFSLISLLRSRDSGTA